MTANVLGNEEVDSEDEISGDRKLLLPLLRQNEILNKSEILQAFQEQELKYLDQIMKWKNTPPDEKTLHDLQLKTLGQQLALKDLVDEAQRFRIKHLLKSIRNPKKSRAKAVGVQKTLKCRRNVQLGWLHYSGPNNAFTQVRLKQGGGTRTTSFSLEATYDDIIGKACDLFFPSGTSANHGDLKDMVVGLARFDHSEINRHLRNGKVFSVKEYQRQSGLSVLRLYLTTRLKETSEQSDDDEDDVLSLGPHVDKNLNMSFDDTIPLPQTFSTPNSGEDEHFNRLPTDSDNRATGLFPSTSSATGNELLEFLQANELPDIPSNSTNQTWNITITRSNIFRQLLDVFMDSKVITHDVKFSFLNEKGVDVGGVSRDVYGAFWSELFEVAALGENERVPCIRSDMGVDHWNAVGRILLKGFRDNRFFPVRLCKAFCFAVFFGADTVAPDVLVNSFQEYISKNEANTIAKALSSMEQLSDDEKDDLMDIFERFQVRSLPKTSAELQALINGISHKELIQKPKYILDCLGYICKELVHTHEFRSFENFTKFLDSLKPTPRKVMKLIQCTPQNHPEMTTYGYLKQYLNSMDIQKLHLFLRFCTGSDCICFQRIDVNFVHLSGAARRPVARTCGPTLDLPITYGDYAEFRAEFNNILTSQENWMMHFC